MNRVFLAVCAILIGSAPAFAQGHYHKMEKLFQIAGISTDMDGEQVKAALQGNGFELHTTSPEAIKAKKEATTVDVTLVADSKQIIKLVFTELLESAGAIKELKQKVIARYGKPNRGGSFGKREVYHWYCDAKSENSCWIRFLSEKNKVVMEFRNDDAKTAFRDRFKKKAPTSKSSSF